MNPDETILCVDSESSIWPSELEEIASPPDELWLRGRVELLSLTPRVAIVGSRAPTPYGQSQAQRFARELAVRGVVIVSGMARGIDEAAHLGALEVGGATIAVLGSGVDRPWPEGELSRRLAREGLLLSEFAPGQGPRRHHFPQRNRVISGLSRAVLVVEAAFASGSLITARWAADQGRSVFAIPGRIDHPMARGCHRLIRDGASLAEGPDDILEELGLRVSMTSGTTASHAGPDADAPASELHARILAALVGETLSSDELVERCAGPLTEVLTALVELELAGSVVRGAGGLFRRA